MKAVDFDFDYVLIDEISYKKMFWFMPIYIILINFVFSLGKNYYPPVFLGESR